MPETDVPNKIRQEIEYHLPDQKKIVEKKFQKYSKRFSKETPDLVTKKIHRKASDKNSPAMEPGTKSYIAEHVISDPKKLASKNFGKACVVEAQSPHPLISFWDRLRHQNKTHKQCPLKFKLMCLYAFRKLYCQNLLGIKWLIPKRFYFFKIHRLKHNVVFFVSFNGQLRRFLCKVMCCFIFFSTAFSKFLPINKN